MNAFVSRGKVYCEDCAASKAHISSIVSDGDNLKEEELVCCECGKHLQNPFEAVAPAPKAPKPKPEPEPETLPDPEPDKFTYWNKAKSGGES